MGERTTVIGTILAVVFQNEENGYTVARIVTDDGEPVTVVGCIPCAAPGEELILTGRYTTHPQHGEQFAADEVERHMPTGETEILNYLASGVVRGIGPATAQKLVDRFGADTLDVLDGEPEKLKTIKGITDKRAREIAESWRELAGLRRVLDFLTKYDLPVGLAMQLFRRYGADAMDALRRNPYLLSGEAFGVDFSVSDEIALSMGFSGDSSCRTEAGVLFELSHNEQSGGHVFLPREKLVAATAQLLDGDTDTVEKALDDLLERGSVVQEQVANVEGCYLRRCHEAETYVCTRVRAMLADKPDKLRGAKKIIDEIERGQGIEYAPLQRQAVELAAQEELLILTGGPGTGKTTSVRGIVALFERMGLDVLLCAPTGRAAKRMGELCGKEAQTIHRLLGMSWNEQTGDVTFTKNEKEPLEADAARLPAGAGGRPRPAAERRRGERVRRSHPLGARCDRSAQGYFPSGGAQRYRAQRASGERGAAAGAAEYRRERFLLPPPPRQRASGGHGGGAVQNEAARKDAHSRREHSGAHGDAQGRHRHGGAQPRPAGGAESRGRGTARKALRRPRVPRGRPRDADAQRL